MLQIMLDDNGSTKAFHMVIMYAIFYHVITCIERVRMYLIWTFQYLLNYTLTMLYLISMTAISKFNTHIFQ